MSEFPPVRPAGPARFDATFVGRGFSWPLEVDHTGSIRLTDAVTDVERSMRIILSTAPGERVMRPNFGCEIWDLLFEPVTPTLFGLIARAVTQALNQWEPRIVVDDVVSAVDDYDDGLVRIRVAYRVRLTNSPRNLVYPFYVIPHESE